MKMVILGFAVLAQLAVPAFMIHKYETTLQEGELYRFNVRPIDPYDPFRGHYVHLNFDRPIIQYNGSEEIQYGDFVYVSLDKDSKGKAVFNEIFTKKPDRGRYLKVIFLNNYGVFNKPDNFYKVNFIFDRYYSHQSKALKIENAVTNNRNQRSINNDKIKAVSAAVRIKDGLGVIEELYVGDLTIHQYLIEKENKQGKVLESAEKKQNKFLVTQ